MWKTAVVVIRDVVCLGIGAWGVVHEELSPHPDLTRMLFFAALATSPGLLAAIWLWRIGSPSSPPPSERSAPPSRSPG